MLKESPVSQGVNNEPLIGLCYNWPKGGCPPTPTQSTLSSLVRLYRGKVSSRKQMSETLLLFETPISTRKAPFISTILLGLVEPANLKNISLDRLMEEETVAVDLSSKASPRHATIPITFQNPDDGIEAFNVPPSHAGLQASRTQLRNLKDSTGDTKSKDVSRLVVSMQLTMWMWKGLPPCPRCFTQRGAPERRN